jgi:23S rRNA pseudouridine2605 synthase
LDFVLRYPQNDRLIHSSRSILSLGLAHQQIDTAKYTSAAQRNIVTAKTRSNQNALKGSARIQDQSSENNNQQQPKLKQKSRKQRRQSAQKVTLQRIDKVLADRGIGTRSKTFELAKSQRITVAEHPDTPHEKRTRIRGPSEKVPSDAVLFLDGKVLPGPAPLLLIYHKPKYMLSVMEDDKKFQDQQRRHLGQVLKPRYARSGMHPVGRLDYDTSGLILFSSDGKLTQRLLHPRRGVEKEYVATVKGRVNEDELRAKLAKGVETTEGVHSATLVEVMSSEGPSENREDPHPTSTENLEDEVDDSEDYDGPYSDVRLIVSEGKYRIVRRMLHNCGHSVVELRRERHGIVRLDDLTVGEFRKATDEELEWARSLL